jgi:hypothetical protein
MIEEKNSEQAIREPKLEQFIGIYPNVVSKECCSDMITWFNMLSEYGLTMTTSEELKRSNIGTHRTDELILIPSGIPVDNFQTLNTNELWDKLRNCLSNYQEKYSYDVTLVSHGWKIHRVQPSGGYHTWHHEHHSGHYTTRVLVWMVVLEAPEKGGETEFLFQSIRVEPKVGQVLIWPAAFTHKHRGNPPLEGQKTYATGWFLIGENLVMPETQNEK